MNYDVFISCKSEDYPLAKPIYDYLVECGLVVFLASVELRKSGVAVFGKVIDAALESAEHMIVFTSKAEYVTTTYVEDEWRTFDNEIRSGRKSGNIITVLKGVSVANLPIGLRKYQSFDYNDYRDLISFLRLKGGEIPSPKPPEHRVVPPNNEIWYTTSDSKELSKFKVPFFNRLQFGAKIVSNSYGHKKGVIVFDGNVTCISLNAFNHHTTLKTISLPESVVDINGNPFLRCDHLVEFEGQLASTDGRCLIQDGELKSFAPLGITTYVIPQVVNSIDSKAFNECLELNVIYLPESIKTIKDNPFSGCLKLSRFDGKFASSDGRCLIQDGVLKSFAPFDLTTYKIPSEVVHIGSNAFSTYSNIQSIELPIGLTKIDAFSLDFLSGLKSIYCNAIVPPQIELMGEYLNECIDLQLFVPESSVDAYRNAKWWNRCKSIAPFCNSNNQQDSIYPKRYKVGDLYDDGTKRGVVFQIWDNGRHGKIVSLEETELPWAKDNQKVGTSDFGPWTNINMQAVYKIEGWREKYPAFAWCANLGEDWYLPTTTELRDLFEIKDVVNEELERQGAKKILGAPFVTWSSTENNATVAWGVTVRDGITLDYNDIKLNLHHVRAVAKF